MQTVFLAVPFNALGARVPKMKRVNLIQQTQSCHKRIAMWAFNCFFFTLVSLSLPPLLPSSRTPLKWARPCRSSTTWAAWGKPSAPWWGATRPPYRTTSPAPWTSRAWRSRLTSEVCVGVWSRGLKWGKKLTSNLKIKWQNSKKWDSRLCCIFAVSKSRFYATPKKSLQVRILRCLI